jgi:simple sugar transport system permease protein
LKLVFTERAPSRGFTLALPFVVVGATFVLTALVIMSAGADPLDAFGYLVVQPLRTRFGILEVAVSATPLLLTGAAVAFAFRAGYWNIGAEGQFLAGAIAAAWMGTKVGGFPRAGAISLMLVAGVVGGAAWALPPALLRVKLGIDEVVTTLLLNPVALLMVSGLLNGPWRDPVTGYTESERIAESAELPQLFDRSRLHLGFVVAMMVIALGWFVTARTPLGVKLRAAGLNPEAARFAGMPVPRLLLIAALTSGSMAGLGGVSELAGIQYRLTEGISPGHGYTGIVVATLAGLSLPAVAPAALSLGVLGVGASGLSRALDVPSQLADIISATLLLVGVAVLVFRRYRVRPVG